MQEACDFCGLSFAGWRYIAGDRWWSTCGECRKAIDAYDPSALASRTASMVLTVTGDEELARDSFEAALEDQRPFWLGLHEWSPYKILREKVMA